MDMPLLRTSAFGVCIFRFNLDCVLHRALKCRVFSFLLEYIRDKMTSEYWKRIWPKVTPTVPCSIKVTT